MTQFACEVTLQPLERFDLDAAILFSDILTIPDAMGLGLYFETGEGPRFRHPVRTAADVEALPVPKAEQDLDYVMQAVSTIRSRTEWPGAADRLLRQPLDAGDLHGRGWRLQGFSRPSSACCMPSRKPCTAAWTNWLTAVTDYLNAQIRAGAQAVQIFDTWGGVLNPQAYQAFSLDYMRQILGGLIKQHDGRQVPAILFTKNGGQWLETMADSGAHAWAWTGRPTLAVPGPGLVTVWPCRATWTRPCCMLNRPGSVRKWPIFWPATAAVPVTSSISAMVSRWMSTRSMPRCSWMRCMNSAAPTMTLDVHQMDIGIHKETHG